MEEQGCASVCRDFRALSTVHVGVKDEAQRSVLLQQDHSNGRSAVRSRSCQRHGVGIVRLLFASLGEPFFEELKGVDCGHAWRLGLDAPLPQPIWKPTDPYGMGA
jgi:hypothetical protein